MGRNPNSEQGYRSGGWPGQTEQWQRGEKTGKERDKVSGRTSDTTQSKQTPFFLSRILLAARALNIVASDFTVCSFICSPRYFSIDNTTIYEYFTDISNCL